MATSSGSPISSPHRNTRLTGRPEAAYHILNVSSTHSRRDPFSVNYGLWLFDDRNFDSVCTVANIIVNTDLSLWTPVLSEDARRQALLSSTEAAVVIADLPNAASAGAHLPLKIPFRSSTFNSERTILMDPCSRQGKSVSVAGASAPPPRGRQGNSRRNGLGIGR